MEKSVVIIKPDAVERNLIGEIIAIYENNDLNVSDLKMIEPSLQQAEAHYAEHKGKSFYTKLIDYITSGPIVLVLLEGEDAINRVRLLNGATDPNKAEQNTIRQLYALDKTKNSVHASDSKDSAQKEEGIWFANR